MNHIERFVGAKGVVTHIMDEEETPRAEHSGDIGIFLPAASIMGRKNTAVMKELYVGKIIFNLEKQAKEMASSGKSIAEIKDLIFEVYDILDPTKDKRLISSIKEKLGGKADEVRKTILEMRFNYMIPPFNGPSFEAIKEAASVLDLELDERVWIPSINSWTKVKVPVGIAYYSQIKLF